MNRLRILVVEDSLTTRKRLCEILAHDPSIEVVGEVGDGRQAIEACQALCPDAVMLDLILPVMNGLEATEYIMAHCPTPILIVTSSANSGEHFRAYDALAAGAVDVLEKPAGTEAEGEWEAKMIARIKLVSRIRVITHPRGRLGQLGRLGLTGSSVPSDSRARPRHDCRLVAIGASTGGPGAMVKILRRIPAPYPIPMLVAMHISESFGAAFAKWLDGQSAHSVGYAADGELLEQSAGRILLAPPGRHLSLREGRLRLTLDPERHSCRPSVDVLFESIARANAADTVACLLTGMGRDGATGLRALRQGGALTIAQDEASCVVHGMPREAVLLGAACRVLPLDEIAALIATLPAPSSKETIR